MHLSRKRLLMSAGGITAVGAAATLVLGATLGLFSAQSPATNGTFHAATLNLGNSGTSCAVTNLVPGETSATNSGQDKACTFTITNTSTAPVYAAVDVFIATGKAAAVGSTYGSTAAVTPVDLYGGTPSGNGLNISISDGTHTFTVPTSTVSCSLAATDPFSAASTALSTPSADTCYEVNDLLLSTSAFAAAASPLATLTTSWSLPSGSGNAYEGGDALIAFNAHAVQSQNNTLPAGCTTVGVACAASGGFLWG